MNKTTATNSREETPKGEIPRGFTHTHNRHRQNRWENDPTPAECKQSENNTSTNANKTTHHAGYADNPSTTTSHPHTNNHSPSTTCSPTAPTPTYSKTPPTSAQHTEAATYNDQTKHQPASEQTAAHGNHTPPTHHPKQEGPQNHQNPINGPIRAG